jgi:hypothetical protein
MVIASVEQMGLQICVVCSARAAVVQRDPADPSTIVLIECLNCGDVESH